MFSIIAWHFQYPQTDRTSCDNAKIATSRSWYSSFSILKRIEPHATKLAFRSHKKEAAFSILKRIEPHATSRPPRHPHRNCTFSILKRVEPHATEVLKNKRQHDPHVARTSIVFESEHKTLAH